MPSRDRQMASLRWTTTLRTVYALHHIAATQLSNRALLGPLRRAVLNLAAVVPLLLGCAVLTAPRPADGMTVLAVDLKALVTTADQVLYGQLAAVRTVDLRKQGRGVWTEMDLSVREVWKGDAKLQGKRFVWRHIGGTTADGMTVAIPGMPTFAVGEEVIVVLEKHSDGHVISGGPQGKFSVKTTPQGQKTVVRELPDVHFLARDPASGQIREAPKQVSIVRSLAEFRSEVIGYVSVAPAASAAQPATANPATAKPATANPRTAKPTAIAPPATKVVK